MTRTPFAPSPVAPAGPLAIHSEVRRHYEACASAGGRPSSVWEKTLDRRGRWFTVDELQGGLAPGSRVLSDIRDGSFFLDGSFLEGDPILSRLLARGIPQIGAPYLDLAAGGRGLATSFVANARIAARLLRTLEAREGPVRVLEIGGGVGLLQFFLRRALGDRLTLYAADIPETLALQEWFHRNWFPEAAFSFKPGRAPARFVEGGINLINAYALDSQPFPFDMAVNIDSMQEMGAEVVRGYIRFAEENLIGGGCFYFENHFGRETGAVPEPSEYPFDGRWRVEEAGYAGPYDTCMADSALRLLLRRTRAIAPEGSRRLALRVLWNGWRAGILPSGTDAALDVLRFQEASEPEAAAGIGSALRARGLEREAGILLPALRSAPSLPPDRFPEAFARSWTDAGPATDADGFWRRLAGARGRLLVEMARSGVPDGARIRAVCDAIWAARGCAVRSEAMSASLGAFLLPLGFRDGIVDLLRAHARNTVHEAWGVRIAMLLARHGATDDAPRRQKEGTGDPIQDTQWAILLAGTGREAEAAPLLSRWLSDPQGPRPNVLRVISDTAARIGRPDLVSEALGRMNDVADVAKACAYAARVLAPDQASPLLEAVLSAQRRERPDPCLGGLLGAVEFALGRLPSGRATVARARDEIGDDYYRCAALGRHCCLLGLPDEGRDLLGRSLALRPGNFLHLLYVADAFYDAGMHADAVPRYREAVAVRPYLQGVWARLLYSGWDPATRAAWPAGGAHGIALLFHEDQGCFHETGPGLK